MSNQPYSEQYRLAAERWVELKKLSRQREEHESHFFNKKVKDLGDVPVSHAERDVKASAWWKEYRDQKIDAWADAELAEIAVEVIRMKAWEQSSYEATRRKEMGL